MNRSILLVTQVVTETVTVPPAKPVIDSFGYGKLKLGMTLKQAMDAKLIGPAEDDRPQVCSLHDIIGTDQKAWVSAKPGVATITFTPAMSSDGVGIGATESKLTAAVLDLKNQDCHN